MLRRSSILILLFSLLQGFAYGQTTAQLRIETNLPRSEVYADTTYLGTAEGEWLTLPAGTSRISLVPFAVDTWLLSRPSMEVTVEPNDTVTVALPFPYVYRLESEPFGAVVKTRTEVGEMVLGETPLVLRQEEPLRGDLIVEMTGYRTVQLAPKAEVFSQYQVNLQPLAMAAQERGRLEWQPEPARHRWINGAAIGLAVASGAVAVHYKARADRLYDEYNETGDPGLRSDIKRFDAYAAVALGGMQVGVGVLAFRLIFR